MYAIRSYYGKVFDIVAVTAGDYMPDFQNAAPKKKAFDLRMLRTMIEKDPHELPIIMNEVLGLPKRKREELAGLLQETSRITSYNVCYTKLLRFRGPTHLD